MGELSRLSATAAANAIRNGDITAEALADCLVGRAQRYSSLNAFISFDGAKVREAAREADVRRRRGEALGALHGVPISFKDNINTAAYPTTAGTRALRSNNPVENAPIASALIVAGAIVFGKNMMHELAFGVTCNNAEFGAVHNPYDTKMIPGGSSGGTAVAVAARLSPAGIGSDTGGSVRVPASLCGLTGMRPTLKRWSQSGIVPIASTRDTAGPLARSVEDLALLDGIITGDSGPLDLPSLGNIRLGVPRDYFWADLDDSTAKLCEDTLRRLAEEGVKFVEADFDDIASHNEAVSFVIALYEPRRDLRAYLQSSKAPVSFEDVVAAVSSPDVRATMESMMDIGSQVSEEAYLKARDHHRPLLVECFTSYFTRNRIDATIFPTTPLTARPIGEDETVLVGNRRMPTFPTFIRNTDPGSNAGMPGVTIPVGLGSDGLPVGIALDGPIGADRRLLAIAAAIEKVLPPMPAPQL